MHFVKDWAKGSWIYARYDAGNPIADRAVGSTTVGQVKTLEVTVFSPEFSTRINYVYQGREKDRDVAERCKDLRFTGRYQPFESGILWHTQRGAEFTLDGVALIPKCRVNVTFRKAGREKRWSWDLDDWRKGQRKTFATKEGQLTFDPTDIDMSVSFPDTSYTHDVSIAVK